jgi:nucleoside-diphosphate-sugar epimerase
MKYLVTGGAGFIGRCLVSGLLREAAGRVVVLDNFSNSHPTNLQEFSSDPRLRVIEGSVADAATLDRLWREEGPFDIVFHLAASIRVQDSIDDPRGTFVNDVVGTFELLEQCRRQFFGQNGIAFGKSFQLADVQARLTVSLPRVVFMSTCMVYSPLEGPGAISELHPELAASPYGASKIAGERLALSYYHSYRLPVTVLRPFNTYGPYQKRNLEGGVVPIFIGRDLRGEPLLIKGDGNQTRDFLFVEDCSDFILRAGLSPRTVGQVINAGLGEEITIRRLAEVVSDRAKGGHGVQIQNVPHDHPQAEIARLLCDCKKARELVQWAPRTSLEEGIRRTRDWMAKNPNYS